MSLSPSVEEPGLALHQACSPLSKCVLRTIFKRSCPKFPRESEEMGHLPGSPKQWICS